MKLTESKRFIEQLKNIRDYWLEHSADKTAKDIVDGVLFSIHRSQKFHLIFSYQYQIIILYKYKKQFEKVLEKFLFFLFLLVKFYYLCKK